MDITFEYPADWTLYAETGDTDPTTYGFGISLFPPGSVDPMHNQEEYYIAIGLHTIPLTADQGLDEWAEEYERITSTDPSSEVRHTQKFIQLPEAAGGVGFMVGGATPFKPYTYVLIPYGEGVWYIWGDYDAGGNGVFQRIVHSFQFGENTPSTLKEAFGPAYNPTPVESNDYGLDTPHLPIALTAVDLPDIGWLAPLPTLTGGDHWQADCGSGEHVGAAEYAVDISHNLAETIYLSPYPGKLVYNSRAGTVNFAGFTSEPGYGYLIIVRRLVSGTNYDAYYAHLRGDSLLVSYGNAVTGRQQLARVGDSGVPGNGHLHFHVQTSGGTAVNLRYLNYFDETASYPGTANNPVECGEIYYQ